MDIKTFLKEWVAAANAYDTESFLAKFQKTAILDDPSVGSSFNGHAGIRSYFEDYFIGYQTQTRITNLTIDGDHKARVEVEFSGNFPGKVLGGYFELTFKGGKISAAKAELV